MEISQYWVGQIPKRSLSISVRDSLGRDIDLSYYSTFTIRLVDTDNNEIDTDGSELQTAGASSGRFVFVWPTDRSLFNEPGDYLLQLEFSDGTSRDFTTTWTIRVRELGEVN